MDIFNIGKINALTQQVASSASALVDLASNTLGKGASKVGIVGGGNIQDHLDRTTNASVAALLASTKTARGAGTMWRAGQYAYIEAASSASDHHITTAGGVKLYVTPDYAGRISVNQFNTADMAAAIELCDQVARSKGYTAVLGAGTYAVNRGVTLTCPRWDACGGTIFQNNGVNAPYVVQITGTGQFNRIHLNIDVNHANNPGTTTTSGSLVSDSLYIIKTVLGTDDFTNVGVSTGDKEQIAFVAQGTTPTTWSNATSVFRPSVGCRIKDITDSTTHGISLSIKNATVGCLVDGNSEKLRINISHYNQSGAADSVICIVYSTDTLSPDENVISITGNNTSGIFWAQSTTAGHSSGTVHFSVEQCTGNYTQLVCNAAWYQISGETRAIANECLLVKSVGGSSLNLNLNYYAGAFTTGTIGRVYNGDIVGNILCRQTFAKGITLTNFATWAVNLDFNSGTTGAALQLGSFSEGLKLSNKTIAGYSSLATTGTTDLLFDYADGNDVIRVDAGKISFLNGSLQNIVRLGGKSAGALYTPESGAGSRNSIIYPALAPSSLAGLNGGNLYQGMSVQYVRGAYHASDVRVIPRYSNQSTGGWALPDGTFINSSGNPARGTGTFLLAGGSQTFTHSLPFTPSAANIEIVKSNVVVGNLVVTAATATTFTVQCDVTPAADITFLWRAKQAWT